VWLPTLWCIIKDTDSSLIYAEIFGIWQRYVIFGDNFLRMARQIIFHGDYFIDFYKALDLKVKEKVKHVLELIKQVDRVPKKFLAPMTGYDGLFEVRIEYQSNIYRIFCCFDAEKLIILFDMKKILKLII
jgi:hypothetical protein